MPVLAEKPDSSPNTSTSSSSDVDTSTRTISPTKDVLSNSQNYNNNFIHIAQDSKYVYRRIDDMNSTQKVYRIGETRKDGSAIATTIKKDAIIIERRSKANGSVMNLANGDSFAKMQQLSLSSDYLFFLNYETGYLFSDSYKNYTCTITRMAKDGTHEIELTRDQMINKFIILGDKIYYIGGETPGGEGRLWQMDFHGENKKILAYNDNSLDDMAYYDGNIIYMANKSIYIYNLTNGNTQEIIADIRFSRSIKGLGIQGDTLYFTTTAESGPNELKKIDLKNPSTPVKVTTDFAVNVLVVDEKYFYWYDKASRKVLRTDKAVGGEKEIVTSQEVSSSYSICEGYITSDSAFGTKPDTAAYPKLYPLQ